MLTQEQAARLTPPRKNLCKAIVTDATARPYDLTALSIGGFTPDGGGQRRGEVYLTIHAETTDVFLYFHSVTDSALDRTAATAVAGTAAYVATHCARIPAGEDRTYLIDRAKDKFIILQSTGAGICRLYASSPADSPNNSEC